VYRKWIALHNLNKQTFETKLIKSSFNLYCCYFGLRYSFYWTSTLNAATIVNFAFFYNQVKSSLKNANMLKQKPWKNQSIGTIPAKLIDNRFPERFNHFSM
jgi:hypothetical protein